MPPAEFWVTAPDVRTMPMSKDGPLVNEGQRLPASVEVLTPDSRPMIWSDLPVFEATYGRNAFDMVYDLGINVRSYYQYNITTPLVLPFDMELLVHIYERYPSSCEWAVPDMRTVFDLLYGGLISSFPPELRERARMVYGARFSRLMGRARTVQYRWLDESSTGRTGSTRRVCNIVSKLYEAYKKGDDPRELLESIAVRMWALRGLDIDAAAPAYDPIAVSKGNRSVRKKYVPSGGDIEYAGGAFGGGLSD